MAVTVVRPASYAPLFDAGSLAWDDLLELQVWRIVTSPLIQPRPGFLPSNVQLLLLFVPLAAVVVGPARAVIGFFVSDWLSSLPTLVVLRLLGAAGDDWALGQARAPDAGSSSGAFGLAGIVVVTPRRRPVRVALVLILAAFHCYRLARFHFLFDAQHAAASTAGLLVGVRWRRSSASFDGLPSGLEQ